MFHLYRRYFVAHFICFICFIRVVWYLSYVSFVHLFTCLLQNNKPGLLYIMRAVFSYPFKLFIWTTQSLQTQTASLMAGLKNRHLLRGKKGTPCILWALCARKSNLVMHIDLRAKAGAKPVSAIFIFNLIFCADDKSNKWDQLSKWVLCRQGQIRGRLLMPRQLSHLSLFHVYKQTKTGPP